MRGIWWLVGLVAACAPPGEVVRVDAGAGSPPGLSSSLTVRPGADSVRFEIHVTNATGGPIALEFPTAQRYDVEVAEPDGDVVWRWSEGMMFAQVLGREELAPGASRRYLAAWPARQRTGDFIATARVTSSNYPVELRTPFRLPAD